MTQRTPTPVLIEAMLDVASEFEHCYAPETGKTIREAAERLGELHGMVGSTLDIVRAQHGAEHMLDGFTPTPRPIDDLLAQFERELAK